MSLQHRTFRWLALSLSLVLFAAACGDDDDGDDVAADTTTTTTAETTTSAAEDDEPEGGSGLPATGAAACGDGSLEELVAAADAEGGEIVWYSSATENLALELQQAFEAEYGINAPFIRLPSQQTQQRYASEAEAGNIAADLVLNAGNSVTFAESGIENGWVESISEAGIPVLVSGEYPEEFNRGATAIAQIAPWGLTYNTNTVTGGAVPDSWEAILEPEWSGQILLPNPNTSDAYIDFWYVLLEEYGEEFFEKLAAQQPRQYESGVPAVQALGAGEGAFELPAVPPQVRGIAESGAPVEIVLPGPTTGVEQQVMLTHPDLAQRPCAARLLANFMLSPDGAEIFADPGGSVSVYDTESLPEGYVSPSPEAIENKDRIVELLGF